MLEDDRDLGEEAELPDAAACAGRRSTELDNPCEAESERRAYKASTRDPGNAV
jgi:hypothetical protein